MKRIYLKISLWTMMAVVVLSACHDELELTPISEETTANAYKSLSQIEAALTGAYESFQSAEYYVWDNIIFQDVRSDNYYAGGDNPEVFEADLLTISPTNSRLFKNWSNIYNAIAKANTVLDKVGEVDDPLLTVERAGQIRGEAYFLRAFHYYTLVNKWGGVPLLTEPTSSADPAEMRAARATVDEVYDQILEDLDSAIALLPAVYGNDASINKGRATAGAAYGLMAKAFLQRPTPSFSEALAAIDSLEASPANYELIAYSQLFDGNNYNNNESILEIQYLGGDEGNYGPQLLLPPSISGDEWRKFITPSNDLINAFNDAGDVVRLSASVTFENVDWVDEYWGNAAGSSVPFAYKWKQADGWASSNRQYVLRYGDMVLLKAEALLGLDRLAEAAAEVNRIRDRANLSDLTPAVAVDKALLSEAILSERRLELAQEGQRWDDLVRYGKVEEVMNSLNEIDLRSGQPVAYNMTAEKTLLPIPQEELDRNPMLVQNPL